MTLIVIRWEKTQKIPRGTSSYAILSRYDGSIISSFAQVQCSLYQGLPRTCLCRFILVYLERKTRTTSFEILYESYLIVFFFLFASGNTANLSNKFCVIGWVKFKTSLSVYMEMFECWHGLDSGGKSESPEMLYGLFNKPTERQSGGVFSGFAKLYQDPSQTYSAPNDTSVNETPFCTHYRSPFLLPLQVSFLHYI